MVYARRGLGLWKGNLPNCQPKTRLMVSLGWKDAPDRQLSCSSTWWKLEFQHPAGYRLEVNYHANNVSRKVEGRATGEAPLKRHLSLIFLVVCILLVRGCPTAAAVEGAVQEGALDAWRRLLAVSIECHFLTPEPLNPHQSTHTLCFSWARSCHNVSVTWFLNIIYSL